MNLILEKTEQVAYFTNMREVLAAAGIRAKDYDWFISDVDANCAPMDDQWISGEALADLLQRHDLQFAWAVFSAVPAGFRSTISAAPGADGNPNFWNKQDLLPQLKGALFEIVCWDSSATILINLPEQAARSFIARYPDTKPLMASCGT